MARRRGEQYDQEHAHEREPTRRNRPLLAWSLGRRPALPVWPDPGKLVEGGVAEKTARVFDNLEAVLADAGLSMDDVVKCSVFLTTMSDFAEMNGVYGERFSAPFPARSTVAVAGLPLGALVEIELVAQRS